LVVNQWEVDSKYKILLVKNININLLKETKEFLDLNPPLPLTQ
jgi:hypothetical protein